MIILNHIYPDEKKRELIRSDDLDSLRRYAHESLDDYNLTKLFKELKEWRDEGRVLAPMIEGLSPSLELVIYEGITK